MQTEDLTAVHLAMVKNYTTDEIKLFDNLEAAYALEYEKGSPWKVLGEAVLYTPEEWS